MRIIASRRPAIYEVKVKKGNLLLRPPKYDQHMQAVVIAALEVGCLVSVNWTP